MVVAAAAAVAVVAAAVAVVVVVVVVLNLVQESSSKTAPAPHTAIRTPLPTCSVASPTQLWSITCSTAFLHER